MLNKWDDDINEAIKYVGGNTYGSSGLPDYAGIIRSQLVANNAIGEGIYQDFLFVNDKNETSSYPWEGEATDSTNAVQASTIAASIKEVFNIMALTERFNVLLVDELPKGEINLSAIYLVRSKCECGDIEENTYTGCYYVKTGKTIKKVDIPEFKINLDELFYLTRAEYDAGLSDYVKEIEDLLRQKFGKYWDDEDFALDKMLDQIVADIETELKASTDKILEDVNQRVDESLHQMDVKLESVENNFNEKFSILESSINTSLNETNDKVDKKIAELDIKVNDTIDELDNKFNILEDSVKNEISDLDSKITTLDEEMNAKINNLDSEIDDLTDKLSEYVKTEDLVALNDEINELK